jgi:transcriptional regulator with XRE-family HTH domain
VAQLKQEIGGRILEVLNRVKAERNTPDAEGRFGKVGFAKSLGIDPSQFSRILKGESEPTLQNLLELSTKYGVDLNWLVCGKKIYDTMQTPFFVNEPEVEIEKSGASQQPDHLLTQLKKQIDDLKINSDRLFEHLVAPDEENADRPGLFQDLSKGKNQKVDKP